MTTQLSRLLATTALSAPILLIGLAAPAAEDIGKVAAVNPSMDGTPPTDQTRRTLQLGSGVIQNEKIETSEDGSGQLLFLDQTSLSIAPRSEIVLDKYVYDPGEDAGEVSMTLTKGVLRLIGGRITKRSDGIIRTPSATIGVRGGLALVIVDAGNTRVCHIAGEYTKVSSDVGGEVVLSRPNACAVVRAGGVAQFDGLIPSSELAEIYKQIEGQGTGGQRVATTVIDTGSLSNTNSGEKRGPNDQSVSTSGHRFVEADEIRVEQEREDEASREFTLVIPQQETPKQETPKQETPKQETPATPSDTPPTSVGSAPPSSGPVVTGLAGASVINSGSTSFNTGFQTVLQGSLIGEGTDGSILRIPVPNTGGTNDAEFDTAALIAEFIPANTTFTAVDDAPGSGSGLFRFNFGDEEFDPVTSEQIAGSTSSFLGDIEGVGFHNPAEDFTYVEFVDLATSVPATGFAVFGNPTVGQARFAEGDFIETAINLAGFVDTSQLTDAQVNQLLTGQTNTVEAFVVQPNQFLHSVREDAHPQGLTPFYMVGNEGFARFGASSKSLEGGNVQIGDPVQLGEPVQVSGKWLHGSLYIGGDYGSQESSFSLLADDIRSYEGSGPLVAAESFNTAFYNRSDEEIDLNIPTYAAGSNQFGTLEDASGNSVFGETNRYIVLSNNARAGVGTNDSIPPAFDSSTGSVTTLNRFPGDPSTDDTTSVVFEGSETPGEYNALLSRDNDLTETIANPLPLAGARTETFYDDVLSQQVDVLDGGYAAGIAICESGQCGNANNFTPRGPSTPTSSVEQTGLYSVRTSNGFNEEFSLNFGGHTLTDPNGAATPSNYDTSNEVQAVFTVTTSGGGNIPSGSGELGPTTTFRFEGGGTTSAYIDDSRFGVVGQDGSDSIEIYDSFSGSESSISIDSAFALASSGLLGTSDLTFPAGTDTDHNFVRWGWWGSVVEVPLSGESSTPEFRTDIVHLGTWVAGVGFDFRADHIPSSGVAAFGGLAVGTMVSHADLDSRVVGGNFNMTYNLGMGNGTFNLSIPDAGLNETVQVFGFGDTFDGRSENASTSTVTDVAGGFFTNPNVPDFLGSGKHDGIAATGGSFEAVNTANRTTTVGIFAGDRTSYTPGLLSDFTPATGNPSIPISNDDMTANIQRVLIDR
ncbi:MAG: FecR domain-containing protein [Pseudomonadota bacterium]